MLRRQTSEMNNFEKRNSLSLTVGSSQASGSRISFMDSKSEGNEATRESLSSKKKPAPAVATRLLKTTLRF
jgi:hypothetical protein